MKKRVSYVLTLGVLCLSIICAGAATALAAESGSVQTSAIGILTCCGVLAAVFFVILFVLAFLPDKAKKDEEKQRKRRTRVEGT